jgi:hypothetical protein
MSSQILNQPPFEAPAPEPEANPLDQLRQRRAIALAPTVRPVHGGFRVGSASRETDYLVSQPNGHLVCTCHDYARHEEEEGFRCKHVLAVEIAQEQGLLDGHEQPSPAPVSRSGADLAVIHRHLSGEDPVRLKLIKNSKGYSWEISVAEANPDAALARLQELEGKVRATYGSEGEE